jgi:hypothetical protein
VGVGQRRGGPRENRVHRARADTRAEQLFQELHGISAGDAVAYRERRYGRVQTRPEGASRHPLRQLGAAPTATGRAANALAAVLAHTHRDRRELLDLVTHRLADRHALCLAKNVPTAAALRPILDDLIGRPHGQQRTVVALMAILGTLLTTRTVLATRRGAGRVGTRRTRGVTRTLFQLALELLDTSLKLPDTPVHPQQNLDNRLPPSVIDRLRLSALHTQRFDTTGLYPPTH